MHELVISSPLQPWDIFDSTSKASKWVTNFNPNVSPIEIKLFSSKNEKVKALIEEEIERKKLMTQGQSEHQYLYGAVEQVYAAKTGKDPRKMNHDPKKVLSTKQMQQEICSEPAILTKESV